ncbi:dual specificity mitogen-activated protein kinase kinase 6-like isoform X1 [Scleropages formosus]|uniref:dual specificity mitogen-activated protein kinase kinase 6-like isoform X1 n=1 Tax=Scleropages formosus TaxID=113540 RepID=UPI000878EC6F|nr:dual specificity mitogen-activated protein kinase kinase 6-like isoform X1 [Scleropages formosus]XP_018619788.1 dual specificity mitogen-activated protein kinase kinase 6-like isoform X1 [Scleropages formosus]XP_018619789.1 dual specificity mitogen-activated protein kinase kinase 6-like isoform X1 [Scleropages formosus]
MEKKEGKKKHGLSIPDEVFCQEELDPMPPRNLDSRAFITIGEKNFEVQADDLVVLSELGRGAYGVVEKVRYAQSGIIMAVKRIRATVNSEEQKRLLMDLDISMRTVDCPYTVTFYGALFREGDVWICMELMDTSLDKFYRKVIKKGKKIPEDILGKIAVSIVKALEHLHSKLSVIHRGRTPSVCYRTFLSAHSPSRLPPGTSLRLPHPPVLFSRSCVGDVKPSNVLINIEGHVKMCDFGISGHLVDSVAKTLDAGCKPYMAPERINPELSQRGYNVKSDVWSLGITLVELSMLRFPYESWGTPFQQLKQVVVEPSPALPSDRFSADFVAFAAHCLKKDPRERLGYLELMEQPFFKTHESKETDVALFVTEILDDGFAAGGEHR